MNISLQGPPTAIGGLFIGAHIEFGEGINWAHVDMAAPAESGERATGYGRLNLDFKNLISRAFGLE